VVVEGLRMEAIQGGCGGGGPDGGGGGSGFRVEGE